MRSLVDPPTPPPFAILVGSYTARFNSKAFLGRVVRFLSNVERLCFRRAEKKRKRNSWFPLDFAYTKRGGVNQIRGHQVSFRVPSCNRSASMKDHQEQNSQHHLGLCLDLAPKVANSKGLKGRGDSTLGQEPPHEGPTRRDTTYASDSQYFSAWDVG